MKISLGRVAPVEPQQDQVNGQGWAWRYKVRIFDKHTEDKTILPDEDLPWAQVLLPVTAGSGAANYAQSPQINQGDTVSILYYDDEEQMPIITGVLPRTEGVSTSPTPSDKNGFVPHSGFSDNRPKSSKIESGESNESNKNSQKSTRSDKFWGGIGDTAVLANTCDPNEYKVSAVIAEINNLINQVQAFSSDAARVESMIVGSIDRIHALVNPYVGEMFNKVFEALVPILNSGLSALYKAVFAKVLAATGGNAVAARLAAEAALLALRPAILALQEAISLLANQVVSELLDKVEALVRDTVQFNDRFNSCAGTQFTGALVNSIISDIDNALNPLLDAVAKVLSGGFNTASTIRGSLEFIKDLTGGFLSSNQGGNKCGGLVKEYVFGVGAKSSVGDILQDVMDAANSAKAAVDGALAVGEDVDDLLNTFGDFPFLSQSTSQISGLEYCKNEEPETCFGPDVLIFGGRGGGAVARAVVGNYIASVDERTITNVQGGIVSIEVVDGGSGYIYPPFVEIQDNCGLGIGGVARAVLNKSGQVDKIYVVVPGEGYPADSTDEIFVVDSVRVVDGGFGYLPGFVTDNFGGNYQVVTDDNGTITEIIPKDINQVNTIPTIRLPDISPPIPPGGRTTILDGVEYVVSDSGRIIGEAKRSNGANIKVILTRIPTGEDLIAGNVPENLVPRLQEGGIQEIIDCIQS